ncbi:MAG: bifunctional (p)ppGpp synthetase/guanosine-3',5'-bis(diphosphate) 3'-pyrophosphohydrolase [Rhodospirillales bacterium 20-64-7]|nr:MAG: bifunctional (p)ppGpp synthetase/guanosine-3',5'-bis(diphosphate) 3'-pyrophosphohydrolase [Rhodospirillales bacterium 20-64-7]
MNQPAIAPVRPTPVPGPVDLAELPSLPGPAVLPPCELTRKIHEYDPKLDTTLIDAAYQLAAQAHAPQRRENGDPYFSHPVAVADILVGYKLDQASIVTGLLHDVIEDTPVKLAEIETKFGKEIAGLVDGVTKLTRLELQSDRTKQAENFRKLVLAMSRDIRVLLVKLADRLHNMRTLHFVRDPARRKRIARETMEIYAPLAERIGMDAVKTELQTLSFMQLEPEAYGTIQARLNFLRGQGADVIDDVRRELTQICQDSGVDVIEVTGREKSPYSIWEKMHRRNVAFEQLSDIMAFRIMVRTKGDCYAALGAVHSAYPVIAGRFKDYISTPKSNGYQSLHTGVTLREPRNQKIEVQIRTADMNDVAENGVAAHWVYKAPDKNLDGTEMQRFRWVQDLLEILDDSAEPGEFLENTKLELYADQVFCFTPKGQLIQLPRGATPVDFAYAVHSQVGDTCVGAKINGRLMPLRHHLENGDQVEIMTARGGTPSPQWERFVVTGKARARIRRFVHQEQRQQSREAGRVELTKAFRQAGVDGSEKALEPALKALKVAAIDDLYIAVGNGNLVAKDVVHAAYPELRQAPRAPRMIPPLLPRTTRTGTRHDMDMPVTGLVPGMAFSFAGCCHPVPGDEIVGIVTTGKGVTIHGRDCQTLAAFAATPERFIDVDWNYETVGRNGVAKGIGHTARVSVIAGNEPTALADVANAIAKQEGAIANLKIVNRQQDFMEVLVDVDVRDLAHLSKVIVGLRGLKTIKSVERATG